jgi:hypothetical protein
MAAAIRKKAAPAPEVVTITTLAMLHDAFTKGTVKSGSIHRIVGNDYDGVPRDLTLSIQSIQNHGHYYVLFAADANTFSRPRNYYFRLTASVQPIEVTPGTKRLAAIAPRILSLLPVRYGGRYIGADPEVFVTRGDGTLFPSFEFLPSKKEAMRNGGRIHSYWDGYQAEFSFTSPPTCMDTLVADIYHGLSDVLTAARKKDPKAQLSVATVMDVPLARRQSDKAEHVAFGCVPSLNVYEDEKLELPDGIDCPFRSSGGHLHFTVDRGEQKYIPQMIKELDRVLGVIGVAMFQYYDDPRRRTMYGRAGEHRRPKYGFEYRVLSSAWTMNPGIVQFVYEMARTLIGAVVSDIKPTWWDASEEEVRRCINNCDVELAHEIIDRNRDSLIALLMAMPRADSVGVKEVERLIDWPIKAGVHTTYKNPDQFSHTWGLDGSRGGGSWQWSGAFAYFARTGSFD